MNFFLPTLRCLALPGVVMALLGLAWGWQTVDTPVRAGHPLWILRHDALILSGLLSIGLMSLAMFLATRPVWLETPLGGMDRVYRTHKWTGILGGVLGIAHWLIEMSDDLLKSLIGRAGRPPREAVPDWLDGLRDLAEAFGEWGFYLLIALLVISLWRRFPYRPWHFLHRAMPWIYLLLAFHAVWLMPLDDWTRPVGGLLGGLLAVGVYGALRSLLGTIGTSRRASGTVLSVARPADDLLVVRCRLDGRWRGHRPGQFAWVAFETHREAHPFTIAAADPGDHTVEFRIKSLGDGTRTLFRQLQVGQSLDVEGPYGRFELARVNRRARQVWVAGGIGITPFLAWLDFLQGSGMEFPGVDLHYCTRNRAGDSLVGELERRCAGLPAIALQVHDDASGEALDATGMLAGVAAGQAAEVWFCGPDGLSRTLRSDLARLGRRLPFHQEAFQLR